MGSRSDRDGRIDELILKTEVLLHGIEHAGDLTAGLSDQPVQEEPEVKAPDEVTALERKLGLKTDGSVDVMVSEDEMVCRAYFYPASEHGRPIDPDTVLTILREHGVTHGADSNAIKESVFTCNTERVEVPDVIVARGQKPRDEVPEHYEIEERLLEPPQAESTDTSIDYKTVSPFILVKEGENLAKRVARAEGAMGMTVTGKAAGYRSRKPSALKPGENTVEAEGLVRAACPGRFQWNTKEFWISKVLEVFSDVDYSTGHVSFDGDVVIHGEVRDGFNVKAGGSISCDKTLDASQVECGKDLFIRFGIVGKNRGRVKAGGAVEARFIENCHLEARGPVTVHVGLMNSRIYTLDRVETSKRGMIIGSTVYAANGVSTTQIGTAASPRTEIYCGVDFAVLRKLEWIRDRNMELAMRLRNIQKAIESHPAQQQRLAEAGAKLRAAIHKLNEAAKSLVFHLHRNEAAEVAVEGTVFPGTFIEICNVSYIVSTKMRKVRFALEKNQGKVVVRAF